MTIEVFYPYIADKPEIFVAFTERFVRTYLQFDSGAEHRLVVGVAGGPLTKGIRGLFYGTNCLFMEHPDPKCDAGSAQYCARYTVADFMVAMTSRTYFWKDGWLNRLAEEFENQGDGLVGAAASLEQSPHLRGCLYGCSPKRYREYPYTIDTMDKCREWETGRWNFTKWFQSKKLPTRMVTWDGAYDQKDWRKPKNIFRRGDQSNLISLDKHSQIYELASESVKRWLERLADGTHDYHGRKL